MKIDFQTALKLYVEEQMAEAQLHAIPAGGEQVVTIHSIALHIQVGGKSVRFDLTGLQFKRAS